MAGRAAAQVVVVADHTGAGSGWSRRAERQQGCVRRSPPAGTPARARRIRVAPRSLDHGRPRGGWRAAGSCAARPLGTARDRRVAPACCVAAAGALLLCSARPHPVPFTISIPARRQREGKAGSLRGARDRTPPCTTPGGAPAVLLCRSLSFCAGPSFQPGRPPGTPRCAPAVASRPPKTGGLLHPSQQADVARPLPGGGRQGPTESRRQPRGAETARGRNPSRRRPRGRAVGPCAEQAAPSHSRRARGLCGGWCAACGRGAGAEEAGRTQGARRPHSNVQVSFPARPPGACRPGATCVWARRVGGKMRNVCRAPVRSFRLHHPTRREGRAEGGIKKRN